MIDCAEFTRHLNAQGVGFFTGVPDSLLKDICGYFSDHCASDNHVITVNEGNAIALAAGHHLATNEVPLVYMQNSGLGNAVNPLTSLASKDVYQIPMLLLIGWRGEPGFPDEPQHLQQGKVTRQLLSELSIPYIHLTGESEDIETIVSDALNAAKSQSCPIAFLVSKNTFSAYEYQKLPDDTELSREDALKTFLAGIDQPEAVMVSTTGKLSRELYEYRKREMSRQIDFYNVGSMGHLSQIALGLSKALPSRKVYCLDGDGAALMHLGGLALVASQQVKNYVYVMFNNSAHDSVGGQPTIAGQLDFEKIALGMGFSTYIVADSSDSVARGVQAVLSMQGPIFFEIKISKGARKDLGRPDQTPLENKVAFMDFLVGSG